MRAFISMLLVTFAISVGFAVMGTPAAFAACAHAQFRAGDDSNSSDADGVRARIQIPESSSVQGYGGGAGIASAADIYLYNQDATNGFVQMGWYVGQLNASTPSVSKPTLWWGESLSGGGEKLHGLTGYTIGWNTARNFKIIRNYPSGYVDFYYAGNLVATSNETHSLVRDASFNGEVDYQGTSMWANASQDQAPTASLQSSHNGNWNYFNDHAFQMPAYGFYSIVDSQATDFAYGGGPANC